MLRRRGVGGQMMLEPPSTYPAIDQEERDQEGISRMGSAFFSSRMKGALDR